MEPSECAEVIKRHPELILVSNNPVTWEGMLTVATNSMEKIKFRLKLTLPNFPDYHDASIKFGKNSAGLFRGNFNNKLDDLLGNITSIKSFLKHLQKLIGTTLEEKACPVMKIGDYSVISELEDVICSSCDVKVSHSYGLNLVALEYDDISMKLERDTSCSDTWKITSCDLAQLQGSELVVGAVMSLNDAAGKLKNQVEALENGWRYLAEIDQNCWVIDPMAPKPHHLYRRIRIEPSLSIQVTINPSEPSDLPSIKVLGSDTEVLKYREIISGNVELWDSSEPISENLLRLLNLDEFPKNSDVEKCKPEENVLFTDDECCICFTLELSDNEIPDRICDNEKCRKLFHTACLRRWLQGIPGNQVVFNQVYGPCPHCGQNITCPLE